MRFWWILPLSQVQTLYDALNNDIKDSKKPGKENHAKENYVKKTQKKSQTKKKDSSKDKLVLPKTLDTAMKMINKKELNSELESGRRRFPNAPLVWLKGLVGYFNSRLTVENVSPVFEGKSHEYPQNLVSGDLRDILKRSVLTQNDTVAQNLFDWCLAAMANDMCRVDKACEVVLGYKLIAQLLAIHNPSLVISAIPKVKILLASYQNRQSIGLSLLWILGQGGYKDLSIGLQVWQQVMFPMVDLRLYSGFVVNYLHTLLGVQSSSQPLQAEDLLPVLKVLCSPPDTVPMNKRKEFQEMSSKLLARVLDLPLETTFLPLFPILLKQLDDSAPERFKREVRM
ncbi:Uncharacterized protein GBIM_20823 [Gryllus bimaculatus]|nr:Uncharacterized protein GBIM_20823 [Gryllus bimaculatus]